MSPEDFPSFIWTIFYCSIVFKFILLLWNHQLMHQTLSNDVRFYQKNCKTLYFCVFSWRGAWFKSIYIMEVDQILAILPFSTLTTVFYSSFWPLALKSILQLCASGNLCVLQNTKQHLHSVPNRPTFLLQVKHLLRSFWRSSPWTSSTFSVRDATSTLFCIYVRGDYIFLSMFPFLSGSGGTWSTRNRVLCWPASRKMFGNWCRGLKLGIIVDVLERTLKIL